MANMDEGREKQLDDLLAGFSDQVLSGENVNDLADMDQELSELQKTILRLQSASQEARPTPAVTARMRTNLLLAWSQEKRQDEEGSFAGFVAAHQRLLVYGGVFLLFIMVVAVSFSPLGGDSLTGTADGSNGNTGLLALAGLLLVAILFVIIRRR